MDALSDPDPTIAHLAELVHSTLCNNLSNSGTARCVQRDQFSWTPPVPVHVTFLPPPPSSRMMCVSRPKPVTSAFQGPSTSTRQFPKCSGSSQTFNNDTRGKARV